MIVFALVGVLDSMAYSGLFRGALMAHAFERGLVAGMGLVDLVGGILTIFDSSGLL